MDTGLDQWDEQFSAFHARVASFFFRAEVRDRSRRYLRSLLDAVKRKNGWQLAEAMGEGDPNGVQRLLFEAVWDEDAVRDVLERFVLGVFASATRGQPGHRAHRLHRPESGRSAPRAIRSAPAPVHPVCPPVPHEGR